MEDHDTEHPQLPIYTPTNPNQEENPPSTMAPSNDELPHAELPPMRSRRKTSSRQRYTDVDMNPRSPSAPWADPSHPLYCPTPRPFSHEDLIALPDREERTRDQLMKSSPSTDPLNCPTPGPNPFPNTSEGLQGYSTVRSPSEVSDGHFPPASTPSIQDLVLDVGDLDAATRERANISETLSSASILKEVRGNAWLAGAGSEIDRVQKDSIYLSFSAPTTNEYHRGIFITGENTTKGILYHVKSTEVTSTAQWMYDNTKVSDFADPALVLLWRIGHIVRPGATRSEDFEKCQFLLNNGKRQSNVLEKGQVAEGNPDIHECSCIAWVDDAVKALGRTGWVDLGGRSSHW